MLQYIHRLWLVLGSYWTVGSSKLNQNSKVVGWKTKTTSWKMLKSSVEFEGKSRVWWQLSMGSSIQANQSHTARVVMRLIKFVGTITWTAQCKRPPEASRRFNLLKMVLQTKPSRSVHRDRCHTPSTPLVVTQASAVSSLESGALPGQLL